MFAHMLLTMNLSVLDLNFPIENGIMCAHSTCTAAYHLKSALGIVGTGFCNVCNLLHRFLDTLLRGPCVLDS